MTYERPGKPRSSPQEAQKQAQNHTPTQVIAVQLPGTAQGLRGRVVAASGSSGDDPCAVGQPQRAMPSTSALPARQAQQARQPPAPHPEDEKKENKVRQLCCCYWWNHRAYMVISAKFRSAAADNSVENTNTQKGHEAGKGKRAALKNWV